MLDNTNWPVFMKKEDSMTIEIALLVMDYFWAKEQKGPNSKERVNKVFYFIIKTVLFQTGAEVLRLQNQDSVKHFLLK